MGQIAASLIAMTGDRDLAEEGAQDAFTRTLHARDRDGAPAVPRDLAHHGSPNRAADVLPTATEMRSHAPPLTPAREAINATAVRCPSP